MFIKIKCLLCFGFLAFFVNDVNTNESETYYMNYGFADEHFDSEWKNDTVLAQLQAVFDVNSSVKFVLFTRNKIKKEITITSIKEKTVGMIEFTNNFNSNLETKIFIHGWKSNLIKSAANNLVAAYHSNRNCNVIALDWGDLAKTSYISSVGYASGIGKYLATMIDFLVEDQRTELKKIHLIGHSMGAHIANFASLFITTGERITRITGLDPAFPLFSSYSKNYRLDKDDADFVDIIHTTAGTLAIEEDIGHVDFYPNGGKAKQPGCSGIKEYIGNICSHSRACDYFIESIENPNAFFSFKCNSWDNYKVNRCDSIPVNMGDSTPNTARGKYYLETNGKEPFSKNYVNIY